jgi:hypothetical protein
MFETEIKLKYIEVWIRNYSRSKASTVFGRSNIGIAGSNPARGMDVCLRFSAFVLVEALALD